MLSRRWVRRSLAAVAAVVVLAAAVGVFLRLSHPHRPNQQARRSPAVATPSSAPRSSPSSPSSPPAATPTPTGQRLTPDTLVIPKIGVRATIEQVTVDSHNDMAAPQKPSDVGWYSPGVAPGQNGDAVIDGHLDWYGVPKAVFYYLDELKAGDEVDVVSQTGTSLRFQVTDSSLVASTAHPAGLFATDGAPRLTLITCAGDWNPSAGQYNQRLLVNASYVGAG